MLNKSIAKTKSEKLQILPKDALVNIAGDLKIVPLVARKILETIGDENVIISDITDLIAKDQAIAARVLKISNSALYCSRQEVSSLQRAVNIIGLKTIRNIVLAFSMKSFYKKFGMKEQIMSDHSLCAGITAKLISSNLGMELDDVVFVGGLMHDIGKIIMNNETPDAFEEVVMNTYSKSVDSFAVEDEVYGYDHMEVGFRVTEKWRFPAVLTKIIKNHHLNKLSLQQINDPLTAKSIAIVNMADNVCKVLGIGYKSPDDTVVLHELPSAIFLGINEERINPLLEEIQEQYKKDKLFFQ